jgi:copper chaperone
MPTFKVDGMTCAHCERAVTAAIRQFDPAAAVQIDLAAGTVVVASRAADAQLADAIRAEGYQVRQLAA